MKYSSLFYYLLLPFYNNKDLLRCNICKKYNIDMNDINWYNWFENECFNKEKREKDYKQREICYYYDYLLDIHSENFWEEWVYCNCLSKEMNSFREEL